MTIGFFGGKMLPLHRGHGYVITQASNMCSELWVGLSHSEERDRALCEGLKMDYVSPDVRLMWLNMLVKDMPNVHVFDFEDNSLHYNKWEDWRGGAKLVRKAIGKSIDLVFGSEESYRETFGNLYPEAEYRVIDAGRKFFPTSSTQIRQEGPLKHWNMLLNVVRPHFVKKVCILGTESCGKSTLVRNLARTYDTEFVAEYGRTMCEEVNGIPLKDKYPFIAYAHQMDVYEKTKTANKILFIDTDSTVTEFYLRLYTNADGADCRLYREMARFQDYDLYIYLTPEVEWVNDGLRQHGTAEERGANDAMLKDLLRNYGINSVEVGGSWQDRYMTSIELVNNLLK